VTVEELEREQAKLDPKDDLSPYEGQWVALRDGRVVASDLDPVVLRDKPEVTEDDVLMLVPTGGPGIFLL
jgi:Family of unknown function (DUF5678)